jgi:hypothetical protein
VLYHATASHGAGLLLHLPWQCSILNSVLSMLGQSGEAGSAAAAAAAVAETVAAGPDKAAVVAAGHGADGYAAEDRAEHNAAALCCVAAADARVLAEAGCWSDADEQFDGNSSSCCSDANAAAAAAGADGSSWGVLGVGSSRLGSLLHSLTGLPSESDSDAGTSDLSSDSDFEDLSGFDAADWGSSEGEEEAQESSKSRCARADAGADTGANGERSRRNSSREGDGLWGLCGSLMPGLDDAVDLELLKEAASSFVAATCQVAAVSAGSLVGALKGSAAACSSCRGWQERV